VSEHRVFIEMSMAEELLDLPRDMTVTSAEVVDGSLILSVITTGQYEDSDLVTEYEMLPNVDETLLLVGLTPKA
jgi:hypothetical protein